MALRSASECRIRPLKAGVTGVRSGVRAPGPRGYPNEEHRKADGYRLKAAKPKEKPYKLADGEGLYLLINPDGSRWWRVKYRTGQGEAAVRRRVPAGCERPRIREGGSGQARRHQAPTTRRFRPERGAEGGAICPGGPEAGASRLWRVSARQAGRAVGIGARRPVMGRLEEYVFPRIGATRYAPSPARRYSTCCSGSKRKAGSRRRTGSRKASARSSATP